jgi:hypothetical protein
MVLRNLVSVRRPVLRLLSNSEGLEHRPLLLLLTPLVPASSRPTFAVYVLQSVLRVDTELATAAYLLLGVAHSQSAAAAGIHRITINGMWPCMVSPDVWPHLPSGLRGCLHMPEAESVPALQFLPQGLPVDNRPTPAGLKSGLLKKQGAGDSLFSRKSWQVGEPRTEGGVARALPEAFVCRVVPHVWFLCDPRTYRSGEVFMCGCSAFEAHCVLL